MQFSKTTVMAAAGAMACTIGASASIAVIHESVLSTYYVCTGENKNWCEAQLDQFGERATEQLGNTPYDTMCAPYCSPKQALNPLRCLCGSYESTRRGTHWTDGECQRICNQPDGDFVCPPQHCRCKNECNEPPSKNTKNPGRCEVEWFDRFGNGKNGFDFKSCSKWVANPGTIVSDNFCEGVCRRDNPFCHCTLCTCVDLTRKYCANTKKLCTATTTKCTLKTPPTTTTTTKTTTTPAVTPTGTIATTTKCTKTTTRAPTTTITTKNPAGTTKTTKTRCVITVTRHPGTKKVVPTPTTTKK